jgi:hypothetical protein
MKKGVIKMIIKELQKKFSDGECIFEGVIKYRNKKVTVFHHIKESYKPEDTIISIFDNKNIRGYEYPFITVTQPQLIIYGFEYIMGLIDNVDSALYQELARRSLQLTPVVCEIIDEVLRAIKPERLRDFESEVKDDYSTVNRRID